MILMRAVKYWVRKPTKLAMRRTHSANEKIKTGSRDGRKSISAGVFLKNALRNFYNKRKKKK